MKAKREKRGSTDHSRDEPAPQDPCNWSPDAEQYQHMLPVPGCLREAELFQNRAREAQTLVSYEVMGPPSDSHGWYAIFQWDDDADMGDDRRRCFTRIPVAAWVQCERRTCLMEAHTLPHTVEGSTVRQSTVCGLIPLGARHPSDGATARIGLVVADAQRGFVRYMRCFESWATTCRINGWPEDLPEPEGW